MGNSRVENILQSIVDGTPYTDPPQSRNEDLLLQVKEVIESGGGGGGGTNDYNRLINKPRVNGDELIGDTTTEDLGIIEGYNATYNEQSENLVLVRG